MPSDLAEEAGTTAYSIASAPMFPDDSNHTVERCCALKP